MPPYNWVIFPLTQPEVANQQQKKINLLVRPQPNPMVKMVGLTSKGGQSSKKD